jgi:hypothetical protein
MQQSMHHMLRHLLSQTSAERLGIVRNTYLAASALSTAILVALTQVGAKEIALKITVVGCAISTPVWLCLAAVVEVYLHMGEEAFPHLNQWRTSRTYASLQYLAAFALFISLCGIVYYLLPWALVPFIAASAMGLVLLFLTYVRLARWWASIHCYNGALENDA